jgi:dCTP diphosphatase
VTEVAQDDESTSLSTPSSQSQQQTRPQEKPKHSFPEWRRVLTLSHVTREIPRLSETIANFAVARLWTRYHTPRNLTMALLGEVGELSELLQFKGDGYDDEEFNNQTSQDLVSSLEPLELDKLSQELADVSIYLLRLATVCNVVSPLCETLEGMAELQEQ